MMRRPESEEACGDNGGAHCEAALLCAGFAFGEKAVLLGFHAFHSHADGFPNTLGLHCGHGCLSCFEALGASQLDASSDQGEALSHERLERVEILLLDEIVSGEIVEALNILIDGLHGSLVGLQIIFPASNDVAALTRFRSSNAGTQFG